MRTIIAIAAALGFLVAVSAPSSAQTTKHPKKVKPTAEQCKADPKLKGCDTDKKSKKAATPAPATTPAPMAK
jgi:hypothetical protein